MKKVKYTVTSLLFLSLLVIGCRQVQQKQKSNMEDTSMNAMTIIKELGLLEHPEGGYFKETYRSTGEISNVELGQKYKGDRNYSTGIYFLLTSEKFSAFHKINQDEMWHFYKGAPLLLHMISKEGEYTSVIIGNDFDKGEVPQYVVKGGDWFAAEVIGDNTYTLVGCTVAPGFDFADFVLPERKELAKQFPQHQEIITKLTHH
ncbi:cupin domain-containing protein [Flavobacteriaceae bacterium S356]|uniref:Cupin domain-containing protein n=1 Tax=Asprobacillus argus TaxID=3076534 RepID=A0ABU3LI32_9FLAO|nr:cupin domain-containing protein [Flavobacteriaceae bacterium S356]